VLTKWYLMSLTGFDALLFADLDSEVMPASLAYDAPAVRHLFAHAVPELVAARRRGGGVRAIVTPDHISPINAGQMLLLPDRQLYEDGLAVLRAGFHGRTLGWNASGPPVDLFRGRHLMARDGSVLLHEGKPARIDNARWDFAGAALEQGFLLYMLLVHRDGAARYSTPGTLHFVEHFAGGGVRSKPWVKALAVADDLERARGKTGRGQASLCPLAQYLVRLALHNASMGRCARRLRVAQRLMGAEVLNDPMPPFPDCLEWVDQHCGRASQKASFFSWPFRVL